MSESTTGGLPGRIDAAMAYNFRTVARKVWSMTRGRIATWSESEVDVIVTNLRNATSAWLNFGSATLTRGPSGVSSALVTAVQDAYDSWVRELAQQIWARVTQDKDLSIRTEITDLVISLKAAINYWMFASPSATDVSEDAPYSVMRIGASS